LNLFTPHLIVVFAATVTVVSAAAAILRDRSWWAPVVAYAVVLLAATVASSAVYRIDWSWNPLTWMIALLGGLLFVGLPGLASLSVVLLLPNRSRLMRFGAGLVAGAIAVPFAPVAPFALACLFGDCL